MYIGARGERGAGSTAVVQGRAAGLLAWSQRGGQERVPCVVVLLKSRTERMRGCEKGGERYYAG